ncbi:unnamed protein product [Acanthoscelides obtectus]|uniref:Macoilin n=1 Tax=Acanthoscelides obtectus TaxID=200917 RepID=A0A9P0P1R8_ACAOB|nr:unnamed protein product [Acanthoscelides obtectus]CAK1634161.1 Macoilin [Acanthoscelides obtectus]
MKRRNAEIAKMRRPVKKNKITEGFYGSTVLYLKFVILWVLVILADFILEFRFEFLWPFYLLLRSVYDSFKYQGLAFSVFFVCIALTSDMLCFFFIPVHWLFFAASTYVWVQYVWHTDKGICLPTVILWVLFVYLEAAVRLRDIKHMPGHLDLCRPFAAHCIGYPVVTLGFGFKSYIGYRIRQRKQQHVAKENQFYMQLMQQALPAEAVKPPPPPAAPNNQDSGQSQHAAIESPQAATVTAHSTTNVQNNHKLHNSRQSHEKNGHIPNGTIANGVHTSYSSKSHHRKSVEKCRDQHDQQHDHRHTDRQQRSSSHAHQNGSVQSGTSAHSHSASGGQQTSTDGDCSSTGSSQPSSPVLEHPEGMLLRGGRSKKEKREQDKDREANEYLQRLESDAKRLRSDLQSSRASEQELRLQVAALTTADKVSKGEISSLQRELEDIQQRLQSALSTKSSDKQTISNLERRIADERRLRSSLESQLNQERKSRKQEEARAAQAVAAQQREQAAAAAAVAAASQQQRVSGECGSDQCRQRRRELEAELAEARREARWHEERAQQLERDGAAMAERARDADLLMSALSAMQEKNAHLENSLSAENRIKLDLFSALGEAKRQLELRETANRAQEKEIEELKSKIAQVLAVMPNDTLGLSTGSASSTISRVRLAESPPSNLDPNATAYTPKGSLVASTEA